MLLLDLPIIGPNSCLPAVHCIGWSGSSESQQHCHCRCRHCCFARVCGAYHSRGICLEDQEPWPEVFKVSGWTEVCQQHASPACTSSNATIHPRVHPFDMHVSTWCHWQVPPPWCQGAFWWIWWKYLDPNYLGLADFVVHRVHLHSAAVWWSVCYIMGCYIRILYMFKYGIVWKISLPDLQSECRAWHIGAAIHG